MSGPADLVVALRGTVLPAALTPTDADGRLDEATLETYATELVKADIGGVAVGAHTGRGAHLRPGERGRLSAIWREATDRPLVVAAGVGCEDAGLRPEEAVTVTVAAAVAAAGAGADAVLVYPCRELAGTEDPERAVVDLHERVGRESGLPVIAFHLYAAAGGLPYTPRLADALLAVPEVIGMKVATLNDAVACQELLTAIRARGGLALTGEDRFLGASLLWGADAALVGIAAACPHLTTGLLAAWQARDATAFVETSAAVDAFSRVTFVAPMEGYVQRMLWAAAWEGTLPADRAHDPFGPALGAQERVAVEACLEALGRTPSAADDGGFTPVGS